MSNNRNQTISKKRKDLDSKESIKTSTARLFKSHIDYELLTEAGSVLNSPSFTVILHDQPSRSGYQAFQERLSKENVKNVTLDLSGEFFKLKIDLKFENSTLTHVEKTSDKMFREGLGVANGYRLTSADLEKILHEYTHFLQTNHMQSYLSQSKTQSNGYKSSSNFAF